MKFFKTVISACSGPSVFPNLMTYPPQRALLHLFLLCLLLAVVISGFKVVDMEHSRRIIAGAFTDYFRGGGHGEGSDRAAAECGARTDVSAVAGIPVRLSDKGVAEETRRDGRLERAGGRLLVSARICALDEKGE